MSEKILDYRSLLVATIAKFEKANALSKMDVGTGKLDGKAICFYHAKLPNTIGCGIGCHFEPEEARRLDEDFPGSTAINALYRYPEAKAIIDSRLDVEKIGIPNLLWLQGAHDSSKDVPMFLEMLNNALTNLDNPPEIPF